MIMDAISRWLVAGLLVRQSRMRLFPEWKLHGLWRPLFHWVVHLWMTSDSCCSDSEVSEDGLLSVGALAPIDGTAVCCARLDDFDWVLPDRVPDIFTSERDMEVYFRSSGDSTR